MFHKNVKKLLCCWLSFSHLSIPVPVICFENAQVAPSYFIKLMYLSIPSSATLAIIPHVVDLQQNLREIKWQIESNNFTQYSQQCDIAAITSNLQWPDS